MPHQLILNKLNKLQETLDKRHVLETTKALIENNLKFKHLKGKVEIIGNRIALTEPTDDFRTVYFFLSQVPEGVDVLLASPALTGYVRVRDGRIAPLTLEDNEVNFNILKHDYGQIMTEHLFGRKPIEGITNHDFYCGYRIGSESKTENVAEFDVSGATFALDEDSRLGLLVLGQRNTK